jgi:hypothetical protein
MDNREIGLEGVDWIHLAHNRDWSQPLVNMVMNMRFQVLMVLSMKMTAFWDIVPCCLMLNETKWCCVPEGEAERVHACITFKYGENDLRNGRVSK